MSIPCNNEIMCRSDKTQTLHDIKEWIASNVTDYCEIEECSNKDRIYFSLDHDYGFPAKLMTQLTSQLPADSTLFISVLTYDQGHEYISHHEYKGEEWCRKYESCVHPIAERLETKSPVRYKP